MRGSGRHRGLADYVEALIGGLGTGEPASLRRMRALVGARRARITLDDESVDVCFRDRGVVVEPAAAHRTVDGEGRTDRATVLALLDGHLEVASAVLRGQIEVFGEQDDVSRIFQAIEILIDGSTRVPELQRLARNFQRDCLREPPSEPPRFRLPRASRSLDEPSPAQLALLRRLELLP